MKNITEARKIELETAISDLEGKLAELRRRLCEVEQERQHEAINHLDDYVKEVDGVYADMKALWAAALGEVEGILHHDHKDKK